MSTTHTTTSASTIRIEIFGQSSGKIKLEIDRIMPDSLSNHISSTEWDFFCNQINNALEPIQEVKDGMRIFWAMIRMSFLVSLSVVVPVMVFTNAKSYIAWAYIAVYVVMVGFLVINSARNATKEIHVAIQEVEQIVRDESAKRSDLSFDWKSESELTAHNNGSNAIVSTRISDHSKIRCSSKVYYHIEANISGSSIPMGG